MIDTATATAPAETTTEKATTPEVKTVNIRPITEEQKTTDYPYGRLRATAFFRIEFKAGKGFRHVFQTINPKNDRLNAPKCDTYTEFVYLYIDSDTGHIKAGHKSYNGANRITPFAQFIAANFDRLQLTEPMIKHLCGSMLFNASLSAKYCKVPDERKEEVKELLRPSMELLMKGYKTGENIFNEYIFPVELLKDIDPTFANY